jgi:flagellar basal body rod protein FlgC
MVDALQGAASGMQNAAAMVRSSAHRVANAQTAPSPEQKIAQAQETAGSFREAAEAMAGAQVSMFRESLDMAVDVNKELIDMTRAAGAYTANAAVAERSQQMLDLIA